MPEISLRLVRRRGAKLSSRSSPPHQGTTSWRLGVDSSCQKRRRHFLLPPIESGVKAKMVLLLHSTLSRRRSHYHKYNIARDENRSVLNLLIRLRSVRTFNSSRDLIPICQRSLQAWTTSYFRFRPDPDQDTEAFDFSKGREHQLLLQLQLPLFKPSSASIKPDPLFYKVSNFFILFISITPCQTPPIPRNALGALQTQVSFHIGHRQFHHFHLETPSTSSHHPPLAPPLKPSVITSPPLCSH